jgi:hypothetical protein
MTTTKTATPSVLDGVTADKPAPTKVIRRRPSSTKATPAPTKAEAKTTPRRRSAPAGATKTADALTPQAAPTLLGANGEMIRHTMDYTVDLLDKGTEPERDYAKVLAKDPSETHHDYVAWVKQYVGVDIDPRTVQILISTYHEFQATPAQKAKTIQKRLVAAQKKAQAEATKKAKAAAAAKK